MLDGLGMLGRLIAEGRLDIKLAFVEQEGRVGIYHEKIGIFRDDLGDLVGFTGSSNETYGGLMANFESVEVYRGWVAGDGTRALRLESDFQALWSNQTPHLSVERFPDVARERLIKLGGERPQRPLPGRDDALTPPPVAVSEPRRLALPNWLSVRDYQKDAVEAWLANQGRGILKMATGTGKTKTAMIAATQLGNVLRQREQPLVVLILAPLQHLVDQWISEVEDFGVRPVAVYESSQKWLPVVEEQLAEARMGQRPVVAMVATNASFSGEKFQSVLSRITQPLLVIADEAHNLGSSDLPLLPAAERHLPAGAVRHPRAVVRRRRHRRTHRLLRPGRVRARAGRRHRDGRAHPVPVPAAARRAQRRRDQPLRRPDGADRDPDRLRRGAGQGATPTPRSASCCASGRACSATPRASWPRCARTSDARAQSWFQLVYCAEGRRPTEPGEPPGPNQLHEVMDLVGNELHLAAHSYISETPRPERKVLMRRFGTGDDLRVLVAMRCLDEGVDIPDARTGYLLASSSNPRQFIQRRGRLLRRAEGKDVAEIFDYLAVPPMGTPINFTVERALLTRELQRANEFGKLSENYETTLEVLRPLKERYQLMDM